MIRQILLRCFLNIRGSQSSIHRVIAIRSLRRSPQRDILSHGFGNRLAIVQPEREFIPQVLFERFQLFTFDRLRGEPLAVAIICPSTVSRSADFLTLARTVNNSGSTLSGGPARIASTFCSSITSFW